MKCSNERHNDCQAGNPGTRESNVAPAGRGLLRIAGSTTLAKSCADDSRLAAIASGDFLH